MESFLACSLYIDETPQMGRGVFTSLALEKDLVIECSPVLVMSQEERILLDKTALHDYIFEWGDELDRCIVAWGYLSVYNHQFESNCEYFMDFEENVMRIKTVRAILAGEELFINYNGDFDNKSPLWFDVK